MVAEFPWYNVPIIIVMVTLLLYQLTRFSKSEKPYSYRNIIISKEDERKKLKKKYHKDMLIYLATYLLPVIFALLSFIAVINLYVGIPLLILAIISTVISEVAIKIWNIGIKQVQGY